MLGASTRWHAQLVPLLIVLACTLAFVALGWYGRTVVLDANPCEMTYSTKAKTEVSLKSYKGPYKLWKISNQASKKLSPYPVLFIPGHLGSDSQARSLASATHNEDGLLQFFAADFDQESVAFHGGDVVTKAAYVNNAIGAIHDLYVKAKKSKDFHLTLVGHSYGGTIAKTSLTLSNHLPCVVNAIVMLGAPITRPPHSVDATSDLIIRSINRGWFHPYYNASLATQSNPYPDVQVNYSAGVSADDTAPQCVRDVRLVSISGGVVDAHVAPEYSSVFEITPRPRNVTTAAPSKVYTLNKFFEVKATVGRILSRYTAAVSSLLGLSSATNASTPEAVETVRNVSGKYGFITEEQWAREIMNYTEPVHVSLRTSQLEQVGFPVDHFAMVWCFNLLEAVHSGLRVLVRKPKASMKAILEGFGVKGLDEAYQAVEEAGAVGIPQLEDFALREIMFERYALASHEEWQGMLQKLGGNHFWLLATQYYTRHLSKIVPCYVALAVLAFAGDVLSRLCGCVMAGKSMPESGIMFHFVLLWHMFRRALTTFGIPIAPDALLVAAVWMVIGVALFNVTNAVPHPSVLVLFWLISFVLAYGLLHVVATTLRIAVWVLGWVSDFFAWPLPPMRRWVRRIAKRGPVLLKWVIPFMWEHLFEFLFVASIVVTAVLTNAVADPAAPSTYWFSVASVNVFGALVLLCPAYLNYHRDHLLWGERATMMVLSVPAMLLSWPSFEFSRVYLSSDSGSMHILAQAYALLSAERLQYCIMVAVVVLHLSRRCSNRELPEIDRMETLAQWTRSMFTQQIMESKTDCCHEDGGDQAVYQRIYKEKDCKFHVGPSYRVTWCACRLDAKLQSVDEWCEWCKCKKCSGVAPPSQKSSSMVVNLDLVLVAVLYVIAGGCLHYGGEKMHVLLYCIGSVSLAVMLRSRREGNEMEISMQGADLGTQH